MRPSALFTSSLFTAAAWPLILAAQQAPVPQVRLDEVVLTATDEGPAGTAPVATISADEIARRQAGSVADILRDVPGISTAHRGNMLSAAPNIRGFGGTAHMASDPSVQVAIDGTNTDGGRVYQNVTGQVADPALLRSASVLKGPLASLEYGSGINGGTVRLDTINGADLTGGQPGYRFRQLLGANSNGDGWVTSSTLAWQPDDRFDFLLNYSRRRLAEQEDGNGDTIPNEGYNLPSLLVKARYRIDEANTVTLSYTDSKSAERDVPYAQATGSPIFGNVNRDREGSVASVAWNYDPAGNDLIDLELKYTRSEQVVDIEALVPGTPAAMFEGRYNLDTDRITLKNTARFANAGVAHNLRAGLDWQRQERDAANYTPSGRFTRFGVFVLDEMELAGDLNLSAGLRVERQKIEGAQQGGAAFGPFTTTARTAGLGVEKGLGAGFSAFGSFTYGEGLATLDVAPSLSATRGTYYGDTVQKSRVWEAGLKYAGNDLVAAGDRLTASASAYQTVIWDALYGVSTSSTAEYTGFTMRGVELEARYDMAQGFYARGSLTINNHSEDYYSSTAGLVRQDYIYTAADQLTLTVGQRWREFDLAWHMHAAKGVELARPGTTSEGPGWAVHDLTLRYEPETGPLAGLAVDLGVENVFDRQYKNNLSYLAEPGRNFKLSLARTF